MINTMQRAKLKRYHVDLTMWQHAEIDMQTMESIITTFEESKTTRRRYYEKLYFPDGILLITHDEPITAQLHVDALWLYQELLDRNEYERYQRYNEKRKGGAR